MAALTTRFSDTGGRPRSYPSGYKIGELVKDYMPERTEDCLCCGRAVLLDGDGGAITHVDEWRDAGHRPTLVVVA